MGTLINLFSEIIVIAVSDSLLEGHGNSKDRRDALIRVERTGFTMTFLQLQYFQVIARVGSIVGAAKVLNVSAPALSKTIHQLEEELGVELFSRDGCRLALNENGKIFLNCVVEIQDRLTSTQLALANPKNADSRMVRICQETLTETPGFLNVEIMSARPGLVIESVPADQAAKGYDIRLFSSDSVVDNPGVALLYKEAWVAALSHTHPLAASESIALASLADEPFLLHKDDGYDSTLFEMCGDAGFRPWIRASFARMEYLALRHAVAVGQGIALVPEKTWRYAFTGEDVALVPLTDVHKRRYVYCAVVEGREFDEDSLCVVQYLREAFGGAE